jgi:hypothetical protein
MKEIGKGEWERKEGEEGEGPVRWQRPDLDRYSPGRACGRQPPFRLGGRGCLVVIYAMATKRPYAACCLIAVADHDRSVPFAVCIVGSISSLVSFPVADRGMQKRKYGIPKGYPA